MTQVHHAPSIYLPRDPGTPVLPDEIRFIGNATTLISIAGFTILTDPNFLHRGERVHLGYGLHSTRRTDPAMEYEDLPPLDAMLLSHLHEDHFDRGVEERLARRTRIVTTPSAARTLKRRGFHEVMGLRRWGRVRFETGGATLTITALPARHGPRMLPAVLPSVMGSMLEFASAERRPLLRM